MNEDERKDERPNSAIGASEEPADAGTSDVRDKLSPTPAREHDTQGQGGKVFAVDPSGDDADDSRA